MTADLPTVLAEIQLDSDQFSPRARTLLRAGEFHVEIGRADAGRAHSGGAHGGSGGRGNGIETLTISNAAGRIVVLPFVGQQIWDAHFFDRTLTMRSIFAEPVATTDYLANYGAYLIHCGGSAMGNPGPGDTHPLHGELPNLPMESARIQLVQQPADGALTLTVISEATHRRAFDAYFHARLALTLGEDSAVMDSSVRLTNLSREPRPLMYLGHINFRTAAGGRLEQQLRPGAATETRGDITVGTESAPQAEPENERENEPQVDRGMSVLSGADIDAGRYDLNRLLQPGTTVLPELVQLVPLQPDDDGWARCRQIHPDGSVDFVAQHTDGLPYTVRWMRRSGDDDAFGMALPATAGSDGRTAETRRGRVTSYRHRQSLDVRFRHGALAPRRPEPPLRADALNELKDPKNGHPDPSGPPDQKEKS